MKKFYLAPYCILLIVINCVAAMLFSHVVEYLREAYEQICGATSMAAGLTVLALGFPRWFWVFGALSFLAGAGIFFRRVPVSVLTHFLLIIAVLDALVLFFFALGIGLYFVPALEKVGP